MYQTSYQHRVLKSDKEQKVRATVPWKKVILISIIVAFIVGIVLLIRSPRFQIQTVNVVGANVADPQEVSQFVMSTLEGRYLWVLPKTSVILANPDTIEQAIATEYPRFKTVVVDRDSFSSLRVTVTEYPGVYLWCDEVGQCSFMDEQGTVFADAPIFSGSAYLKVYVGSRATYPFHPLTDAQLATVVQIDERLRQMDIEPVIFDFVDTRSLHVTFLHHSGEPALYFDPADDVRVALDTLYTGLRTQPLAKLYHDRSQVLQYIDLRFGNKLVYKFQ